MERKRNACIFRFFNQYEKQHLPCKCALSRHLITFNRPFNNLSTLSTFQQVFNTFNSTKNSIQKLFNIIQHSFNTTFNIVNHVNTLIPVKLTLSTAPTITTIILLLLFIIILISANRKRGYITTTINHVFKCHLQHFAKRIINTHVNILQTSFETIDKNPLSGYNNKRTRYIFFLKSPFIQHHLFLGAFTWVQKNQKTSVLFCTRVISII